MGSPLLSLWLCGWFSYPFGHVFHVAQMNFSQDEVHAPAGFPCTRKDHPYKNFKLHPPPDRANVWLSEQV